jgi:putative phosphoribosyl transferase
MERFRDREHAGRSLARLLERFRAERPVVAGIPRGGVPVAAEVARALGAPLDAVVARKVGAPSNPEYGIGAVAEGGACVIGEQAVHRLGIGPQELAELIAGKRREVALLTERLRSGRPPVRVQGRTAILVDDGLATGRTAHAAAISLRRRGAGRVVLAVPVAATGSAAELSGVVDEVVCVHMPRDLWAIGFWYEDFRPTSEEEVVELLERLHDADAGEGGGRAGPGEGGGWDGHPEAGEGGGPLAMPVTVRAGPDVALAGDLTVPAGACGVVVFAHGSGSSRHSPRNRAVARALNRDGLATLLIDLLAPAEEADRANVFNIPLLARRLSAAVLFAAEQPGTRGLALGCFGASTGAAAALVAAADLGDRVGAVVSRGGRPDLAGERLGEVTAPTLLIVGGEDAQVLELNRIAQGRLRCPSRLEIVAGATHLFEEPGALDQVARLAGDWFRTHLGGQPGW